MRAHDLFEGLQDVNRQKCIHRIALAMLKDRHWCLRARKLGKESSDGPAWIDDHLDADGSPGPYFSSDYPQPTDEVKTVYRNGGSSADVVRTEWFKHVIYVWAAARYDNVIAKLKEAGLDRGDIRAHRFLRAPHSKWEWGARHGAVDLGLHWTYDIESWGDGMAIWASSEDEMEWLVEAIIPAESIDWPNTIMSNMDYYSGDREYEVRVLSGADVRVKSIREAETDKPVPVSLTHVRFTA